MLIRNTIILQSIGLLTILLGSLPAAIAAVDANANSNANSNSHSNTMPVMKEQGMIPSEVVPQTTCKLALIAQAEQPIVYGQEKVIGRVYNVIGNSVYMELDNGSTYIANLSIWERGKLGNIIGRRLVVTPYYCNRANLDTTLYFTPAKAIEVPPLTFSNSSTTPLPIAPRTEMPSREAPSTIVEPKEIIPQTW